MPAGDVWRYIHDKEQIADTARTGRLKHPGATTNDPKTHLSFELRQLIPQRRRAG